MSKTITNVRYFIKLSCRSELLRNNLKCQKFKTSYTITIWMGNWLKDKIIHRAALMQISG